MRILIAMIAMWLSVLPGPAWSQGPSPLDGEFRVNTYTTFTQTTPSVGLDADGDLIVVWRSNGSSGSDTSITSIQGQRYDAAGVPQASEFQINT